MKLFLTLEKTKLCKKGNITWLIDDQQLHSHNAGNMDNYLTKNGGIPALDGHRKQKCGFRGGGVGGIRDRNSFSITGL